MNGRANEWRRRRRRKRFPRKRLTVRRLTRNRVTDNTWSQHPTLSTFRWSSLVCQRAVDASWLNHRQLGRNPSRKPRHRLHALRISRYFMRMPIALVLRRYYTVCAKFRSVFRMNKTSCTHAMMLACGGEKLQKEKYSHWSLTFAWWVRFFFFFFVRRMRQGNGFKWISGNYTIIEVQRTSFLAEMNIFWLFPTLRAIHGSFHQSQFTASRSSSWLCERISKVFGNFSSHYGVQIQLFEILHTRPHYTRYVII